MKKQLLFILIFCGLCCTILFFGFNRKSDFRGSSIQEDGFLGLFASSDQKWGLTPAIFGKMQMQLQNDIRSFAVYGDGSINKNLSLFTPEVDDYKVSQIENPDSWGTWKIGKKSEDGTGSVVFTWNDQPQKNDTIVVYPLPKAKKDYRLVGRYDMYISLVDHTNTVHKYSNVVFEKDGSFKMKNYNRFLNSYEKVPFEHKDQGTYFIDSYTVTFTFNDGRTVVTNLSHIPPKNEGGSDMLFIGGDHGFKER